MGSPYLNYDHVDISFNQNYGGGIAFYSNGNLQSKDGQGELSEANKDESWLFRKSPDPQSDELSMDSSSVDWSPPHSKQHSRKNTIFSKFKN